MVKPTPSNVPVYLKCNLWFTAYAVNCPHRVKSKNGMWNCTIKSGSISECKRNVCPKFDCANVNCIVELTRHSFLDVGLPKNYLKYCRKALTERNNREKATVEALISLLSNNCQVNVPQITYETGWEMSRIHQTFCSGNYSPPLKEIVMQHTVDVYIAVHEYLHYLLDVKGLKGLFGEESLIEKYSIRISGFIQAVRQELTLFVEEAACKLIEQEARKMAKRKR